MGASRGWAPQREPECVNKGRRGRGAPLRGPARSQSTAGEKMAHIGMSATAVNPTLTLGLGVKPGMIVIGGQPRGS